MTDPPSLERRAAADRLRASDAERERTAAALRRHHLDGRIDTDELQERLGRCYAARTLGELGALTADLPGDEPPRAARPHRAGATRGPGPAATVALVAALLLLTTLALAHTGHPGPFPILAVLLAVRLLRGPRRPAATAAPR